MSIWCPECGWKLRFSLLSAHHECDGCGNFYSDEAMANMADVVSAHGTYCDTCQGTGTQEVEFTEYHPYGDTVAPEHLVDIVDCEECGGKGYFLDEDSCVVCGEPVKEGVLVEGWEVHERCATYSVPTLLGFDG